MITSFVAAYLIKATVVLVVALAAARAAGRARAAVRHLMLASAFAVLLLLPLVSLVAPAITIPVPMPTDAALVSAPPDTTTGASALVNAIDTGDVTPPARAWRPALSMSALAGAVWIAGVLLLLLPLAAGAWQIRRLRLSGLPWRDGYRTVERVASAAGIRRRIDVLRHEAVPGPVTWGVWRPAIVPPIEAITWAHDELRRALVHELEHVRRGDWLTQGLARGACLLYWFHPLAWIARRQLLLEAERACDDAVVRHLAEEPDAGGDATAYADQLVGLAARLSAASRPAQLAMAGRRDLATRVLAVLDTRQRRGRAGVRWVVLACAAAALMAGTLSPLRVVAQDTAVQQAAAVRFDAATIRPCKAEEAPPGPQRGTAGGTNATFSPGRMNVPCVTLEQLIFLAYAGPGATKEELLQNVPQGGGSNPVKVRGGPDWVHSQRDKFAVEATAAGATDRHVLLGSLLRTLLEERFRLKVHREEEDVPMYAMTIGKSGLKVKPMKDGDCQPFVQVQGQPVDLNSRPCGSLTMGNNGPNVLWRFNGMTLNVLSSRLSSALDRQVIDRTEESGEFVYHLEFHPDENTPGIKWPPEREADTSAPPAASVFTALEQQLGLKLEKTRAPRGYLVIDRVEPLGK